jgi:lipid II:glycine glycyltransferase (peptidoglycan interpeptide bridge formation enzyme)
MEIRSAITGTRAVSLPFTDYCEPLFDSVTDTDEILHFALELGRKSKWAFLELRSTLSQNRQPSDSYLRHTLTLTAGKETVYQGLRDSTRRNIRKAVKEGVEARISHSWEAMNLFYRLHCITRRRHGVPPQPIRFFRKIQEHVISNNKGFVVLASYRGRIVAAAIFLYFGKKALFKFGASDAKYQILRPSNILIWTAIQYCLEHQFDALCFGRTHPGNEGLRQFKNGWGTMEDRINYYRYDLKPPSCLNSRLLNTNISSAEFAKLPLPFLRLVGAILYRHFG